MERKRRSELDLRLIAASRRWQGGDPLEDVPGDVLALRWQASHGALVASQWWI